MFLTVQSRFRICPEFTKIENLLSLSLIIWPHLCTLAPVLAVEGHMNPGLYFQMPL